MTHLASTRFVQWLKSKKLTKNGTPSNIYSSIREMETALQLIGKESTDPNSRKIARELVAASEIELPAEEKDAAQKACKILSVLEMRGWKTGVPPKKSKSNWRSLERIEAARILESIISGKCDLS